ncbi:MAG: photosystem II stability/assembly factor-like protein, partial [Saprospiraceae bacterium]|nr:photosystem II stability/assembly factor-like protein [Saprospiraceae bacterium]
GFCGSLDGTFLRTTDGGATWTDISAAIPGNAPGICGLSHQGQNVYGCGIWSFPAYFVQSYDAGETWEYQDMSEHAIALIEPLFFQADSGFVAGQDADGGVILFTPDRGATWQKVHNTGVPGEYVWKLQMVSRDTLFASVENFGPTGSILVSHDGGKNWMRKEFNYAGNIQAIGFLNGSKGWVGGYFDGFHETNDGGDTWQNIGIGNTLNRIFVVKPNLAYASGESVYKFQGPEPPSATAAPMPRPDLDWNVAMAGHTANIQLNLSRTNNVNIGLYTIEGRWLRNIFNGRLAAGKHEWKESLNFSAGTYLIGLQTNEGLSARKISLAGP